MNRTTDAPEPHPTEAPIVQNIFATYAETRIGTRALADSLNERGVTTKSGKPWSGCTIGRMLANRVYIGDKVFGDSIVPNAHPAIINELLFDEVQHILTVRGAPGSRRAASNSAYNLTGLITCPECGLKYIGTSATSKGKTYRYYSCFARIRYGRHGCRSLKSGTRRSWKHCSTCTPTPTSSPKRWTPSGRSEPASTSATKRNSTQ